jgi:hypothetical protein
MFKIYHRKLSLDGFFLPHPISAFYQKSRSIHSSKQMAIMGLELAMLEQKRLKCSIIDLRMKNA